MSVYEHGPRDLSGSLYFHDNSLTVHCLPVTSVFPVTDWIYCRRTLWDTLFIATLLSTNIALITITCYAVCTGDDFLAWNIPPNVYPPWKPQFSPLCNPISLSIFSLMVLGSFYLIKWWSSYCLCGVIKVSEAGFNCWWIGLLWLMKPLVWAACTI